MPLDAHPVGKNLALRCQNLEKWYGNVHALRDFSLDVERGEVLGLVGDNGAGKTTLIKILSGVHEADGGQVFIEDQPRSIKNPRMARELGIETIYQYNSTIPTMSVARNIFIAREPVRWALFGVGPLDAARMKSETAAALEEAKLTLRSPDATTGELSGGQRQSVAIARARHFKSKILILDEPTNHLSVKETDKVLAFVKSLRGQDITTIFISHNLHHVLECCDRVAVMSRGAKVAELAAADTNLKEITDLL